MSHGPEHHIEEAEHAAHAVHDGFNRNVTMSIAIVAAVLACVTMLGHRAHNDTLRLQGEALKLQADASILSTETANKWAYYQGKNMFNLEAEITVDLLRLLPIREDRRKEYDEIVKGYEDTVEKYRGDRDFRTRRNDKANEKGKLAKIEHEANELGMEAKKLVEQSEKKLAESHFEHVKAARFDFGELFLQFGVVLCSLAILTRGRGLWYGGIVSAAIGAGIAATGQFGIFVDAHHEPNVAHEGKAGH